MKDWKQILRKDIQEKLGESKKEYQQFLKTGSTIYLQQAGNKLFSAVENFLMIKHNTRARNYQHLKQIVQNSKEDKQLLFDAAQLHYFFYNAQLQMETDEAVNFYERVEERLKEMKQSIII
jgi:hypothetical protein